MGSALPRSHPQGWLIHALLTRGRPGEVQCLLSLVLQLVRASASLPGLMTLRSALLTLPAGEGLRSGGHLLWAQATSQQSGRASFPMPLPLGIAQLHS